MKFVFIFLFVANAFAQDANKVCHEIIANQSSAQSRLSTMNIIRGMLFPSKIVQMKQNRTPVDYVQSQKGHNHIILNILKSEDLKVDTLVLREKLAMYNNITSNIKENVFAKKASQLKTFEECVQLSLDSNLDFIQFMKLSRELELYISYQKQFERLESFDFVKKKLRNLINNGWTLHEMLDVISLNNVMMSNPEQLIILTHTTSNGVIVDANNNALPASIFTNTPTSLRKLSLFSCYIDQTQKTYGLERLVTAQRFDFVYPVVRSAYKSYFDDSTPLLALSALSKYHKKRNMLPVRSLEQKCSIKFDQNSSHLELGIYVNNQFIGLLKDITNGEKKFYCDILKDANSVSFNLIDKINYTQENIANIPNSLVINNGSDSNRMNLKHFFRENKYLSSKTIKE